MKAIRRTQTALRRTGNRILSLFSALQKTKEADGRIVDENVGLLRLRLLIQLGESGGVDLQSWCMRAALLIEGMPNILIEIGQADMPSDKWAYMTVVREGILEWQGYLSRPQETRCASCGQFYLSPLAIFHTLEEARYNIHTGVVDFVYSFPNLFTPPTVRYFPHFMSLTIE